MRKLLLIIIMFFLTLTSYAPPVMMFSFIPEKKSYFPQHCENEAKAVYLKFKLSEYTKHPAYQRRGRQTFCNVWARDILDDRTKSEKKYCFFWNDFHYDITPVFPRKNNIYMKIGQAYRKALRAEKKGLITSLTAEQAQKKANRGKLIWGISRKYNHEFLVAPGEWDDDEGCWIAQAGWTNGIFRISAPEVFGKNWRDPEIKYYEFREVT